LSYDSLAPWYEWAERIRFADKLQRARTACLDRVPPSPRVLFVGDGDGRLLEAFVARQSKSSVVSVDLSRRMLELQQQRLGRAGLADRVRWIRADSRSLTVAGPFDLIVTAFHLDGFDRSEMSQVARNLFDALKPDGLWYVVDFVVPAGGRKRRKARFWLRVMIEFFRRTTDLKRRTWVDHREVLSTLPLTVVAENLDRHEWLHSVLLRRTGG